MQHTSPETKRHYQLGMTEQVRQAVEQANERAYGRGRVLHFYDSRRPAKKEGEKVACKYLMEKEKLAPRARFELATLRLTAEQPI
jgi:hypothetical protein